MVLPEGEAGERLLEVYRRHGGWIRARVRRLLRRDWEDGEQEVLLRLQQTLGRMRSMDDGALRVFVGRTVRSVCIDELRRRSRRPVPSAAIEDRPDPAPGAHAQLVAREREALLAAAWQKLPERDRHILKLRFHEEMTLPEIAELLGVPLGSAAGWYSRALDRLRGALS